MYVGILTAFYFDSFIYRCQDYVSVTDSSGVIENCGTDPGNNDERLTDREL